ncbi:MAG: hypothetical protein ACYCX2_00080 [Christensenellales bacterium]
MRTIWHFPSYFHAVYSIGIMSGPIIAGAISQVSTLSLFLSLWLYRLQPTIGLVTPLISLFGLAGRTFAAGIAPYNLELILYETRITIAYSPV